MIFCWHALGCCPKATCVVLESLDIHVVATHLSSGVPLLLTPRHTPASPKSLPSTPAVPALSPSHTAASEKTLLPTPLHKISLHAGRWLTMLRMLLEPIGVPCNITSNGPLTRRDKQERIEFLAATRNALLPPIGSGGGNERTGGSRGGAASTPGGAEARAQGRDDNNVADRSLQGPFAASDVLFVNDVLFCAGDALRLLWLDADFACGLDFGPADNNRDPGHESRRRARRLMQEQKLPQGSGGDGGEKLQQRQLRQGGGNAHRQLQQQQQRPPQQPGNGSEGGGDEQQQQLLQQQQQFVQRQQQLLQEQQQKITQHSSQDFGEPGSTDSSSPAASGTSAPAGNAGSNNSKDGPKGQGMRRLAGYAPIIIKQSNPVVKLNFSMVLKKAAAQKRSPNSTEAFVRMPMYGEQSRGCGV